MADSFVQADPGGIQTRADLARNLTVARENARLTIRDIARLADVPPATVGGYFSGRHLPSLTHLEPFHAILDALGIAEHAPWIEALTRVRWTVSVRATDDLAPYKGLESYQVEDAGWFFGREDVVAEILDLVLSRAQTGGVVTVIGASGSGKSSVLRAGVIPQLSDMEHGFSTALMTPGRRPSEELAKARAELLPGGPSVLIVDQFEEIFTQCEDVHERSAFVEDLVALGSSAVVVVGMRADFYAAATRLPDLVPALQNAQIVVGPLSIDNLRAAVVEPARRAGVDIDPELIDRILRDIAPPDWHVRAHDAGALPLLSHALRSTWERGGRHRLSVENYLATGGIVGAVAQSADEVLTGLSAEGQELARQMFLRLVSDDGETVTRRRATWDELIDQDQTDPVASDVLERFIAARLLTADANSVTVSHEALLTTWPRIQTWVDGDRAGLRLHRQLTDAATAWEETGRELSLLWRGGRLESAREWSAPGEGTRTLSRLEQDFLEASQEAADAESATATRRTRRLQLLLGVAAVFAVIAVVAAALAVRGESRAQEARDAALSRQIAIQANVLVATNPALAQQLALAAYRVSPTVEARSALLDVSTRAPITRIAVPTGPASLDISPDGSVIVSGNVDGKMRVFAHTDDGVQPLGEVLVDAEEQMYGVAISPDKQLAAVGGTGESVYIIDLSDPSEPVIQQELPAAGIEALTFSPDGQMLVGSSRFNVAHRWQIGLDGEAEDLGSLTGFGGPLHVSEFSPDSSLLATSSNDGIVRVWEAGHAGETDEPIFAESVGPATNFVLSASFNPDGSLLAVGSRDALVRIYAVSDDGMELVGEPIDAFSSAVNALQFSPDGSQLTAGSSDATVRVFDVVSREEVALVNNTTPITSLFYVAQTDQILFGSPDGFARIWRRPGASLPPSPGGIFDVVFSADGQTLAVGATTTEHGVTQLWDVRDSSAPQLLGETPDVEGLRTNGTVALNSEADFLAVGTSTGEVLLFDSSDPQAPVHVGQMEVSELLIQHLHFNSDATLLAVASDDAVLSLWDVRDRANPVLIDSVVDADDRLLSAIFDPSGQYIAAASADHRVYLYRVEEDGLELIRTMTDFENFVHAVAFSSDGRTLAVGSADRRIRLFDVADMAEPQLLGEPLTGPQGYVYTVAFSADNRQLTAVADGVTWLWDTSDARNPEMLGALRASSRLLYAVAISPLDGSLFAGGADRQVLVWNPDAEAVADWLCGLTGNALTEDEWAQYVPGAPYTPPCP